AVFVFSRLDQLWKLVRSGECAADFWDNVLLLCNIYNLRFRLSLPKDRATGRGQRRADKSYIPLVKRRNRHPSSQLLKRKHAKAGYAKNKLSFQPVKTGFLLLERINLCVLLVNQVNFD
ncbi:MAG: hypothetical protein AAF633_26865, partial [Chloroflexota bacterium]